MRELRTWTFYTKDTEGRTCIFNVRDCKSPERTKDWRVLQQHLEKPHIESVGYIDTSN